MSSPDDLRPTASRRRALLSGAAAALLVTALVALGLVVRGGGEAGRDAAAATTAPSSAATSSPPGAATAAPTTVAEPAPPSGDPAQLPPSLPAVAFDQEATGEDGVSARVVALDGVRGTAVGPGNIAGPALRVTVRLDNGTAGPVDLSLVSVTMTTGTEGTPASPLDDPSRVPFGGTLQPAGTAEGVYFFSVPEGERDVVTLTVGYRAGAPFLVFTGSVD